jgi:hypothetical protein
MEMNQASISEPAVRSAIREHVQNFWPSSTIHEEQWKEGPIQENVPGLRVLRVKSRITGRPVIYVTNGCFTVEPSHHVRHEFLLISPKQTSQHVETLTMLANFHADERYRLHVGSVVSIGDPWIPDSRCDNLLISIPYPYGPKLEWLRLPDICVRFLWALPITGREAAFVELNGLEALEEKFDSGRVDYLNPARSSVI